MEDKKKPCGPDAHRVTLTQGKYPKQELREPIKDNANITHADNRRKHSFKEFMKIILNH